MGDAGRDLIELRLPPSADLFATARALASDVTGRADFDLDSVADVRMAVDEACNQVAVRADPRSAMRVGFYLEAGYLWVTVTARTGADAGGIDVGSFGWHVLEALTDKTETEHRSGPDADELVVRFAKKGPPGS